MTARTRFFSSLLTVAVLGSFASAALAVDPPDLFYDPDHIAEFVWTGTADGTTWQTAGNWTAPTFPEEYPYFDVELANQTNANYPNDPGRIDTLDTEIWPVVGANLSGALSSDLTVDISGGDVTIASLKMGGTGAAVTTSITSASNLLVFEHQELNDFTTNPGDPGDPPEIPAILPEPIWSFNQGNPVIWSTGTTGGGKVNRIDAKIKPNDDVDVEGDRDLHIYGNIVEGDRLNAVGEVGRNSSLSSLLSGGAWLYLHGDIETVLFDEDAELSGTQDQDFHLNASRGNILPADPQVPIPSNQQVNRSGRIDMTGRLTGDGEVTIGLSTAGANSLPLGTVILRGDSGHPDDETPAFTGRVYINRGNLVLAHDNALGGGDVKGGGPGGFGFNLISDDDDRVIATPMGMAQWMTVRGAEGIAGLETVGNHSIEFSGEMIQTNTRGWINILPYNHATQTGKTLTISGPQYPLQGGTNEDSDRIYTVDGSGRTLITGGIHDFAPNSDFTVDRKGHFRKRGSGTVVIDYDETNENDTPTDHAGWVWMEGGNLHYAKNSDLPMGTILSRGGAVGVDDTTEGVIGNTTFLEKLNNSQNPNHAATGPWFNIFFVNRQAFTTFSSGGLMLAPDEYGDDLDFTGTQAANPLARAANMSLAAHEGGSTYTGTITPASLFVSGSPPSGIRTNANTYMLGGGAGVLTLPNNNQLVNGAATRNLLVTNGGEVVLEGTNTYTGTTRIVGKYLPTNQGAALANQAGAGVSLTDDSGGASDIYRSSKLTVLHLGDGSSSIGNSTESNPANLVIQGSTLQYKGAGAVSTNRLFTIGTVGATIEVPSDAGVLTFNSTSALAVDIAESRIAVVSTQLTGGGTSQNKLFGRHAASATAQFSTEDLVPGMRITSNTGTPGSGDSGWVEGLAITGVDEVDVVTVGGEGFAGWTTVTSVLRTINFGPAPARFLTLTGSNAGDNTFKPLIGNASDIGSATVAEAAAGFGTVGIRKTGAGKWILTNNNTYGGATNVEAGKLLVNGTHSGAGLTTVSAGATLGGTGSVAGGLTNNGTLAPGTSIGTFGVTGTVTMGENSIYAVELSGTSSDQLVVTGDIDLTALANTLNVTTLSALSGTSWVIATYTGALTGVFETVTAGYAVDYGTGANDVITLMLDEGGVLIGDYNNDGKVSAADYTVWRDHVGATTLTNRDPDNDGLVDDDDYDSWLEHYGESNLGSGAGAGFASASVPEPSSLLLGGLAILALFGFGRRRS